MTPSSFPRSGASNQARAIHSDLNEGPCLESFKTGHAVSLPDLDADERFPRFSKAGVEAGLAAVFTFPLAHGKERFGALDLYRDTPGDLDAAAMSAAQTLADVAAALLLNSKRRDEALAVSDQFHHNAMHDQLTGLPNRFLLQERLEHAALRAHRTHTYTAVLFLDLDGFKHVNDTHGHIVGDQLLRSVAQRLSTLVRCGDTLSRFSGDEFVFLCDGLATIDDVSRLVARIDETFLESFELDDVEVAVSASVGLAYVGPGEAFTSDLLTHADDDMYHAKRARTGVGAEVIQIDSRRLVTDDQSLEDDVRRALHDGNLQVAYQPMVRTNDGRVTGVEALLRWTHPDRGPIPPLTIVSIAEQSDLICEIGAWVLEQACQDHAKWTHNDRAASLDLAVNVSVRQLMAPDLCSTVRNVLDRTGMDPHSLILELTESIVIEHDAQIMQVLVDLAGFGVRLALDDFGTGYSALSYLGRMPIDIIKLDRSFIAELDEPATRFVVTTVTAMAHELGLEVVAEGIETEAQRDETIAIGCDYTQGYLHARPMYFDDITPLLRASPRRRFVDQSPR